MCKLNNRECNKYKYTTNYARVFGANPDVKVFLGNGDQTIAPPNVPVKNADINPNNATVKQDQLFQKGF